MVATPRQTYARPFIWLAPILHASFTMNKATTYLCLACVSVLVGDMVHADDSAPPPTQSTQTTLPRVVVTGRHQAEEGYRVDAVDSLGPLGATKILDTPLYHRHSAA